MEWAELEVQQKTMKMKVGTRRKMRRKAELGKKRMMKMVWRRKRRRKQRLVDRMASFWRIGMELEGG